MEVTDDRKIEGLTLHLTQVREVETPVVQLTSVPTERGLNDRFGRLTKGQ